MSLADATHRIQVHFKDGHHFDMKLVVLRKCKQRATNITSAPAPPNRSSTFITASGHHRGGGGGSSEVMGLRPIPVRTTVTDQLAQGVRAEELRFLKQWGKRVPTGPPTAAALPLATQWRFESKSGSGVASPYIKHVAVKGRVVCCGGCYTSKAARSDTIVRDQETMDLARRIQEPGHAPVPTPKPTGIVVRNDVPMVEDGHQTSLQLPAGSPFGVAEDSRSTFNSFGSSRTIKDKFQFQVRRSSLV
jgi:hypothetical protein